jgi:hypothetical protein
MPIKSWDQDFRIPRFGMVRLGETGPKGNPIALDYFVVPDEVKKVYGERPTELDILLPSENMAEVLTAWYKRYGKTAGLICRGDEETAMVPALHIVSHPEDYAVRLGDDGVYYDAEGHPLTIEQHGGIRWVKIPCDPATCKYARKEDDSSPSCRPIAILNFFLPDVPGAIGVYSIATGSKRSYQNLLAGITLIRNRLGYISDIPMKLRVSLVEFHPVVKGKKISTKKPIIDIRLAVSYKEALALSRERRLQLTSRVNLNLEPLDESVPPETFYVFDEPEGADGKASAQENTQAAGARGGGEDFTPPCDYDDDDGNAPEEPATSPSAEAERKEPSTSIEKPSNSDGAAQGGSEKPASKSQISYIQALASKRLNPDKPDTWPPLYAKMRESGSLTASEASTLITDLKLMPPLNLPAGNDKAASQPEKQPEPKSEAKGQPQGTQPSKKPAFKVVEGESITFLVIGMPRATSSMSGLAVMAKARIEGSEAIWEISWSSTETAQVRPNGYKYQAIVEKVQAEARKAFVKDLKVQS